jgi:hypothetical protein
MEARMKPGGYQLEYLTVHAGKDHSYNMLSQVDIKLRPSQSSQDILRLIPGLFIAQHAGGGKAEQIFLRGFDVDHGTDINLEVDGLPVNMVSHAHGQGYSDLHFVIPELVNYVDFNKGPYYADKGDFTTAGYVSFQTKNTLDKNFFLMEGGQFRTLRGVVGVNLVSPKKPKTTAYIASEFVRTDGFVESPQDFNRINVQSKFTRRFNKDHRLIIGASFFASRWKASGQIPERAVQRGLITRFGSMDDTEGGETSRANIFLKHQRKLPQGGWLQQQAFAVGYGFNLFSNFTFYKNDPVNGDQIEQRETRGVYGYKANYDVAGLLFGKPLTTAIGIGFRFDDINNISLSHTLKREFLEDIKRGNIDEFNGNVFWEEKLQVTENWSVSAAMRLDYFRFQYEDKLSTGTDAEASAILSPKLNINYILSPTTQLYVRSGIGFHSNDSRVVVARQGRDILPKAYGIDLGINTKLSDRLFLNAALWRLDLDQELVFVGDEGVVEPAGKTQREGVDLSIRYQIFDWLYFDQDLNFTKPKSKETSEKYIPLAPPFSSIGGLTFRTATGFNGAVRYRYLKDRPANPDKTVIADGYFLTDALLGFSTSKFAIDVSIENIFDVAWREARFDTESRLKDEPEPVSEIHFTPGTPLFIKAKLSFFF